MFISSEMMLFPKNTPSRVRATVLPLTIAEEAFDKDERMWTIRRIKRIYDVSAVDFPAYEDTWVEARKAALLEAEAQEKRRAAEAALARRRLQLKLRF